LTSAPYHDETRFNFKLTFTKDYDVTRYTYRSMMRRVLPTILRIAYNRPRCHAFFYLHLYFYFTTDDDETRLTYNIIFTTDHYGKRFIDINLQFDFYKRRTRQRVLPTV